MTTRPALTAWTPVRTADGSPTLAHPGHGETCHSVAGAWQQARERYADGCRLTERARAIAASGGDELRLLDIGTGLGLNLAAALAALDGTGVRLCALSFELDRRVIETTLALPTTGAERAASTAPGAAACTPADRPDSTAAFEFWHAHVRGALVEAIAQRAPSGALVGLERGTLQLVLGDARKTLPALASARSFDAVFLDGFSPRVDPALWEPAFLAHVARAMAPGSRLSTYSAAVSVRAGLLAAGLCVGPGARVGTKAAGTIASPDIEQPPFPSRLARRLTARARRLGPSTGAEFPRGTGVRSSP